MKLIHSERSKSNSLNSSVEERHLEEPVKSCEDDIINDGKRWQEKVLLKLKHCANFYVCLFVCCSFIQNINRIESFKGVNT